MTTPDRSPDPGITDSDAILRDLARELERRRISENIRRITSGYFTLQELSGEEIAEDQADSERSGRDVKPLPLRAMLQIVAKVDARMPVEDLEGIDDPYSQQLRTDEAELALHDYKDVEGLMKTGLNQNEAIEELLGTRSSEIDLNVAVWQGVHKMARARGEPVPAKVEDYAKIYLEDYGSRRDQAAG